MTPLATTPALTWAAAAPGLVLAAVLLWAPGMVVARLAGARGLAVLAVAPVLTLGMLAALAGAASTLLRGHAVWTPWGATVAVGLAIGLAALGRALAGWRVVADRTPGARPRSNRVDALPALLACLVSGATFAVATGAAGTVEQSNDSPFHLQAVAAVAASGDGSWQRVRAVTGDTGFYPPLFDDVAALLARALAPVGIDVLSATSILLLLLVAVVWPLGVDSLVRTVLTAGTRPTPRWRPDRVARGAAMALVPATAAFPAQLVQFGALWPNLLGLALVPAVLAALVDLTFPHERRGARASLWTPGLDVAVLVLGSLALALGHPDALLSLVVAGAGLVAAGLGRLARRTWATGHRATAALTLVLPTVLAVVALVVVWRLGAAVTRYDVGRPWSPGEAVARVVGLDVVRGTHRALAGPLALLGIGSCLGRRRHRWLVVGWALSALLVILAGGVDGRLTAVLTGLWYQETARLSSALVVTALPLAALGAVEVVRAVAHVPGTLLRRAVAAGAGVAALAWVVVGVGDVHRAQRDTYQGLGRDRTLVTPEEAALYARTLGPGTGDEGAAVVGDPFGGAMFAGLYSGRPNVIAHWGDNLSSTARNRDRALVARSFRSMTSDPAVCAAVRRLDIGYAVEDTDRIWTNQPSHPRFAGLRGLGGTPGLELVGREGPVSVYRVTACR